jgi:hypothetical protein
MDPQETIRLLDELVDLGFGNDAFHVLHHFGDEATIRAHARSFMANNDYELGSVRAEWDRSGVRL